MATTAATATKKDVKEFTYSWTGTDKAGKTLRGEMKAGGEAVVNAMLRRQGVKVLKVKKQSVRSGGSISDKDITLFTRQLATMMKSGVPLLQAFDIVGKGHSNPAVARLLMTIKADVETGMTLKQAFEKHPLHFDALFCNLVGAGEAAGILESLLDRLATYKEKILGNRQGRDETELLLHNSDACSSGSARSAEGPWLSVQSDRTRIRCDQTRQQLHQG